MKRHRYPNAVRAAALVVLAGILHSCDLWGPQDNPVDPGAGNYQGYPTVSSSNLIRAILPADGGDSYDRYLTVTAVDGAESYQLRISDSIEGLDESSPLFEKSDYSSNVFDIGDAPLSGGRTYFWKARALRSGTWETAWSPVGSFFAVKNEWTVQPDIDLRDWKYIGMSGDGTVLAAQMSNSLVWISRDGGSHWFNSMSAMCLAVSSSSVFTIVKYLSPSTYISNDGGITWAENSTFYNESICSIGISSTGLRLIACDGVRSYITSDSGLSWRIGLDYPSVFVASSSNGSQLYAASHTDIMASYDYGKSWRQLSLVSSSNSISSLVCNPQGKYLACTELNGSIWTSPDYGETWVERASAGNREWRSIAISSDGSKLVAVEFKGYIWTSTDYGVTWKAQTGAGIRAWTSVACGSNGTRIAACTTGFNNGEGWIYGLILTGVLSYWE